MELALNCILFVLLLFVKMKSLRLPLARLELRFLRFYMTFLQLITRTMSQTPVLPNECVCDGTEYTMHHSFITSWSCGRIAMCAWSMNYYYEKMDFDKIGIQNFPKPYPQDKNYFKDLYTVTMKTRFPYPIETASWVQRPICDEQMEICKASQVILVESECRRLKPEAVPPPTPAPPPEGVTEKHVVYWPPGNYKYDRIIHGVWNWWKMYFDGFGSTTEPKIEYNQKNHYPVRHCPTKFRYPQHTLGELMWETKQVQFHEFIMLHDLAYLIPELSVRKQWCDLVRWQRLDLYIPYNYKEFCNNTWYGEFLCLNLKETDENKRQRDPDAECAYPPGIKAETGRQERFERPDVHEAFSSESGEEHYKD